MKINKKIRLMLKASECLFIYAIEIEMNRKNERIARHFTEDFFKLNYYLIKITSIAFNDDGGTDNDEGASCEQRSRHNYCEFFCISMLEKLIYSIDCSKKKYYEEAHQGSFKKPFISFLKIIFHLLLITMLWWF